MVARLPRPPVIFTRHREQIPSLGRPFGRPFFVRSARPTSCSGEDGSLLRRLTQDKGGHEAPSEEEQGRQYRQAIHRIFRSLELLYTLQDIRNTYRG